MMRPSPIAVLAVVFFCLFFGFGLQGTAEAQSVPETHWVTGSSFWCPYCKRDIPCRGYSTAEACAEAHYCAEKHPGCPTVSPSRPPDDGGAALRERQRQDAERLRQAEAARLRKAA
jgi:hypothetical protein